MVQVHLPHETQSTVVTTQEAPTIQAAAIVVQAIQVAVTQAAVIQVAAVAEAIQVHLHVSADNFNDYEKNILYGTNRIGANKHNIRSVALGCSSLYR